MDNTDKVTVGGIVSRIGNWVNIDLIIHTLRRNELINHEVYLQCRELWSQDNDPVEKFKQLLRILQAPGCTGLFNEPSRQTVPNDELLVTLYVDLRRNVENWNPCMIGELRKRIGDLAKELESSSSQALIDTVAISYYVYAQTEQDIAKRNLIMKEMRDTMPHGVNRVAFNAMYHSLMSINCAINGNMTTAEKHEDIVKGIKAQSTSTFIEIIIWIGSLYKKGIQFERSRSLGYYSDAVDIYHRSLSSTTSMPQEGGSTLRNIATIEHVRPLLGISLDAEVSDITEIETSYIRKARNILSMIHEDELKNQERRQMKYLLFKGRLNELSDLDVAIGYTKRALDIAVNEKERRNIGNYLKYLKKERRPNTL